MKRYKYTDEKACEYTGIDPDKVESCCKRIARAAKELEGMGLSLFGGCFAQGSVRTIESFFIGGVGRNLVVGHIDSGSWDGGDGGEYEYDGLTYSE